MQLGFYFDQTRCIGCFTCIVACKDWNDVPAGPASWRRVITIEKGTYPDLFVAFLSTACYHCANPACSAACPVGAISKRDNDGVVIVDSDCNDVAMIALPTAPIDQATGLPVPTIAVATDAGVSVITDGGVVWDITRTGGMSYVSFDENNRLDKEVSWDVAATSQQAFEDVFFEVAMPYIEKYKDYPIIITGGCGLNILLATKIREMFPDRPSFVAPNTNDCGIALGLLAGFNKPETPIDITYGGTELMDKNCYPAWIESNSAKPVDFRAITHYLMQGKIFGVARGRCEHGPRALGNRSIICNPAFPEMKDILNHKVKHREWYRPFAPVCRLENASKYFEWEGETKHMLYCPRVREEWQKELSSITHVDGTARLQTVTREQNPWLYDLLGEFEKAAGHGVLLNTSFNIAGKPILNTISDAMKVLETSEMDFIIIEG